MQYIDVSRFIFSLEDAPSAVNSVVLEQSAYDINSPGYRCDRSTENLVAEPQWQQLWFVNLRLENYTFEIDRLWKDLDRILHNSCAGTWLSIDNITGQDVTARLFEKLVPVPNKRIYIELHHINHPLVPTPVNIDNSCIPTGFELVDVHHSIDEMVTRFIPLHPKQSVAEYTSKPANQLI